MNNRQENDLTLEEHSAQSFFSTASPFIRTVAQTIATSSSVALLLYFPERRLNRKQTNMITVTGVSFWQGYKNANMHSLAKNTAISNHHKIDEHVNGMVEEMPAHQENASRKVGQVLKTSSIIALADTSFTNYWGNIRFLSDIGRIKPAGYRLNQQGKFFFMGMPMRYFGAASNAFCFVGVNSLLTTLLDPENEFGMKMQIPITVGAGICAGFFSNTTGIIYKLQLRDCNLDIPAAPSSWRVVQNLYANEGLKGFKKGWIHSSGINVGAFLVILGVDYGFSKAYPIIEEKVSQFYYKTSLFFRQPLHNNTEKVQPEMTPALNREEASKQSLRK